MSQRGAHMRNYPIIPSCFAPSSPSGKNIPLHITSKSPAYGGYPVPHRRGVGHRHGRWAWDAVDAEALLTKGAKADGEVVWF